MLANIKKLLIEKPKHAIKMIKNRPELWAWVETNCDLLCIDDATKVYTAITGEKILCPCGTGNLRKLISIKDGLSFCGIANKCVAAQQAVSNNCIVAAKKWDKEKAKHKRAITNMEKYGVENIGQTAMAKQAHSATYKDKKKVQEILSKMQATCIKKYKVKNIQQQHISKEALTILNNKELFTTHLLKYGRIEMAKKLGIWDTTISKYHLRYNLDIIKPLTSSHEAEIENWLNTNGIIFKKDRIICKPRELDFYIPEHNLAIEFDGLYWHSESIKKDKNYHILKTKKCAEQGIQLIHIFEDEWLKHKNVCKSIIFGLLNKTKIHIPARKCSIQEISNKEMKLFLDTNHLQGHSNASKNIVLLFNNEIVVGMSFGKPRYNKNIEWELLRLATKCNTHIIGGTKKLWNYFLKTVNPTSVVSYCDRRWFTGKIYETLKFIKCAEAKPTYWYTNYYNRFHRSKFTKKHSVKAALLMSNNIHSLNELNALTENQITKEILGLDRIWDCGQDTWIWKNSF
jgi:hypothetical protein